MDYLEKTSKDFVRGTGAYGDWLRLAGPQHSEAIGTAYYFYSTRLMAELAAAIGKSDDVQKYRQQAENIKAAFVKNFLKEDGRIVDAKGETGQTFYALAFGLDLVPADRQAQVAQQFVKEIEKQDGHLATGFLGTPFVLFALEKAGQTDLAYQLLLNDTYPSWLLQVKLGSTTMWERWDGWLPDKGFQDPGMNSFNHYWLGCVGQWLQCSVAGIDTDGPGFAQDHDPPGAGLGGQGADFGPRLLRLDPRTDRQPVEPWRRRIPPERRHSGQHRGHGVRAGEGPRQRPGRRPKRGPRGGREVPAAGKRLRRVRGRLRPVCLHQPVTFGPGSPHRTEGRCGCPRRWDGVGSSSWDFHNVFES